MADDVSQNLTTGAQMIVELARQKRDEKKHTYLGVNHWLLALLERHGPMIRSMYNELDIEKEINICVEKLNRGELGLALKEEKVAVEAAARAKQRNKMQGAERDVVLIVLSIAGLVSADDSTAGAGDTDKSETPGSANLRKKTNTPTLDQFGKDLTQAAREGKIPPVIGREDEIQLVIETLCRRTKRNPVLVGQAGVGKTAIVEGLAKRVVDGNVPELMHGVRIIALQPSTLMAGAHIAGELEKRLQNVVKEAGQDGIFLFIDEIHTIMGTGGMLGTSDMASILKPSLARGEIAVIAATTDDEYRRFIETDSALERRFQPIRIQELSPEESLQILFSLREVLYSRYPVRVDDAILKWLIDFGHQYMRNRHFPDKAVDLLEQCFAHAVAKGKTTLELQDAEEIAQRMIGMPLALDKRLEKLQTVLGDRGLLSPEETQFILNRLQVTMRGLDLRSSHPNAILLLSGDAVMRSGLIARSFADALYGSEDRVITIDFARFTHPADISLLVGSPPGYVGYSESLPIHRLIQTPWCVLEFQNLHACFPSIREVVTQALESGWIMDGRGKQIYFSDAVIVLTADVSILSQRGLGFRTDDVTISSQDVYKAVVDAIGEGLANQIDLFVAGGSRAGNITRKWLEDNLLTDLSSRFAKQGLDLTWDESMINWLLQQQDALLSERDWERWVDQILSPSVIPFLPQSGLAEKLAVLVKFENDKMVIDSVKKG